MPSESALTLNGAAVVVPNGVVAVAIARPVCRGSGTRRPGCAFVPWVGHRRQASRPQLSDFCPSRVLSGRMSTRRASIRPARFPAGMANLAAMTGIARSSRNAVLGGR